MSKRLHGNMPGTTDRLDFGPPRDAGSMRAFGLALLVHVLLIAALTWGVNWKRSDQTVSFEAELWSSVPKEAAPKLVETAPTPPPPAPLPPTPSPPPPPPPPKAPEVKVTPPLPDVDIAMEQEKKRKLLQAQKDAEAQKVLKAEKAAEKLKAELQAKKEKEKEKAQQAKEQLAKRKAFEEAKKVEAIEAKKQEAKDLEKQKQAAEQRRKKAMDRMMGQADATGDANAKGSAQKSSGPSAGYPGKVRAAVKPNVVFTEDIAGNPKAEIEVRTTLDGTIISQRLVKSSGNKAWDDAAIKGVIRTGTLPRDVDGRVPTPLTLIMSPKD